MTTMESGAAEKNKRVILEPLRTLITPQQPQRMLEVASGMSTMYLPAYFYLILAVPFPPIGVLLCPKYGESHLRDVSMYYNTTYGLQ